MKQTFFSGDKKIAKSISDLHRAMFLVIIRMSTAQESDVNFFSTENFKFIRQTFTRSAVPFFEIS